MKLFTENQKSELLYKTQIRKETVEDDPDSADDFEATEGALEQLIEKLNNDATEYTEAETNFLIQEIDNCIDIANGGGQPNEKMSRIAYIRSMEDAKEKLQNI